MLPAANYLPEWQINLHRISVLFFDSDIYIGHLPHLTRRSYTSTGTELIISLWQHLQALAVKAATRIELPP